MRRRAAVIGADTVVLIDFVDAIGEIGEGGGFIGPPAYAGAWHDTDREGTMIDLAQLWYHRDLRFLISDAYLTDSRKPLTDERARVRRRVIKELDFDCYGLRGGTAVVLPSTLTLELEDVISRDYAGCPVHPDYWAAVDRFPPSSHDLAWPTGARDRKHVEDALAAGAHVFLTRDNGILKRAPGFTRHGLAIMTPVALLDALQHSGELDHGWSPLIDLDTLARMWKITATATATEPVETTIE